MKWTIRVFAFLILSWAVYYISPYVALYRVGSAVLAGDRAAVAERIDLVAVRRALASDILLAASGGRRSTAGLPSLASVAAFVADPLVAEYVTEDAIFDLVRGHASSTPASQPLGALPIPKQSPSWRQVLQLFVQTDHRGFTKVAFRLPLDQPRTEQYGLLFRLSDLTWKISAIELPEGTKQRIVQEILKKRTAGGALSGPLGTL